MFASVLKNLAPVSASIAKTPILNSIEPTCCKISTTGPFNVSFAANTKKYTFVEMCDQCFWF